METVVRRRSYMLSRGVWCTTSHGQTQRQAPAPYGTDNSYNGVHHTCPTVEDGTMSANICKHCSLPVATERDCSTLSIAITFPDYPVDVVAAMVPGTTTLECWVGARHLFMQPEAQSCVPQQTELSFNPSWYRWWNRWHVQNRLPLVLGGTWHLEGYIVQSHTSPTYIKHAGVGHYCISCTLLPLCITSTMTSQQYITNFLEAELLPFLQMIPGTIFQCGSA